MFLSNQTFFKKIKIWVFEDEDELVQQNTKWKHLKEYEWTFNKKNLNKNFSAIFSANIILNDWIVFKIWASRIIVEKRTRR